MSTKHFSPETLNARRLQAVRLRLDGMTVAETAQRTGLSPPTVSAAWKAFREGGWEAVPVRPRGRPAGQGATLGDTQRRQLAQRLAEWPPGDQPGWSARTLAQSLGDNDDAEVDASPGDVSPRAVEHWLTRQDLKPAPLDLAGLERRRTMAGRWYRRQVLPAIASHSRGGGHVWQAGARVCAATPGHPRRYQLFAHGKRDTLYTRCFTAPPRADDYLQLFTRLRANGGNVVIFRGADLTASPEIDRWLEQNPQMHLVTLPVGLLPSGKR
ncbi:helix-turn-helix domain-containing protein [Modicisalibacter tunisiensis]|uniref:helix-turn-helix domain-containing protein n=1 Tax=Modicisalibacter tunisiensis TaxID=390637 RepID=UPI001CCC0DFE|nr:helix-turn-helix domain-containing protein [Modicisalibacter tunisiensis]MBZ9539945.1 helix-turn-helix domain-containing protein [Modicisalibacter tunisiensis]